MAPPTAATVPELGTLLTAIRDRISVHDVTGGREMCRARLRIAPRDADGHRYLALLLATQGDGVGAVSAVRRACELAPGDARCWSDAGRILAHAGRFGDAIGFFERATLVDGRCVDAWHNLGVAWHRLGDPPRAFAPLKTALALDDTRADSWLALGNLLLTTQQLDDALLCFERAARHDPTLARARSRLAQQLATRGRVARAEQVYRECVALDPAHLPGWAGLGNVLEDAGEAAGALACYRHVLASQPRHALVLGRYLALLPPQEHAGDEATLEVAQRALHAADTTDDARALIGYGLARYHDRRGDFAGAARAGRAANTARRRDAGALDRAGLVARIDGIIATCTRDFFVARRGFGLGTDQPVFVVGLPRSGTTLTEQILGSHQHAHGAGELDDLARIAAALAPAAGSPWEAVKTLTLAGSREHAGRYVDALRAGAPLGCLRILDKAPFNFFHLGFIALLFPNARVVHCRREARDNALSIWMENFNAAQKYATDFDDLAFFHAQYTRLMAHWLQHLPLPLFECRYEDTVADVTAQARALLRFAGLPWDSRCLEFHANRRAVQTPSRWQVRQPVYTHSVGRWRRYAHALPDLVTAFPVDDRHRSPEKTFTPGNTA